MGKSKGEWGGRESGCRIAAERQPNASALWTSSDTRRLHFRHDLHVGDGTAQQLRAPCVAKR
eukprot:scaffold28222_cov89-Phaeocystis_antarctica.AAC.10